MRLEVYNDNNHIINEMARIGTIEPDNIEIMIFQSEGPVPHFHFVDKDDIRRCGCIKIESPEYFVHGKYTGRLSAKEKRNLMRFLVESCKISKKYLGREVDNYTMIKFLWDLNNPDYTLGEDCEMPDYDKL